MCCAVATPLRAEGLIDFTRYNAEKQHVAASVSYWCHTNIHTNAPKSKKSQHFIYAYNNVRVCARTYS